jgi:hypothetical protein
MKDSAALQVKEDNRFGCIGRQASCRLNHGQDARVPSQAESPTSD